MKLPRVRFNDLILKNFNELLPYVFSKLAYEYERMDKVRFTMRRDGGAVMVYGEFKEIFSKSDSCSCGFFKTMSLPCRHNTLKKTLIFLCLIYVHGDGIKAITINHIQL